MTTTTEHIVRTAIAEVAGMKPDEINLDDTFEHLALDSIDIVECVMWVEDDAEIHIDDDQIETLRTVGDLIAMVEKLRK